MPNFPSDVLRPQLEATFKDRWNIPEWKLHFPWWGPPATCRILMYGDSSVALSGGGFQGLTYVRTLLQAHAYYYVHFTVDFCHRDGSDPSATVRAGQASKLTDLDIMNAYDEIWLFGFNGGSSLNAAEVVLLDQFMAAPKYGGVLTTGDHADLGQGLSGQIKRVGSMRQYPAPPAAPPVWNTTIVPRPGEVVTPYQFDDQSDDIPQTIRWKRYRVNFFHSRPHPVLCGPNGPIDVLPDHEHEGEALAPAVSGNADWPTFNNHQEAPEVIAWGSIKDPGANKHGQEIGVVSAYNGHMSDVGRIVADSTWHHWFDINILGRTGAGAPYTGYASTLSGQDALKKIDAYYLNCGVWLAPPSVQSAMRHAAWWSIIWLDKVIELPAHLPLRLWGAAGIDALGFRAPRCAVFDWVWPKEPIYKPKIPWWEWVQVIPELDFTHIPVEEYMAGGILRELSQSFGALSNTRTVFDKPPSAAELSRAIDKGREAGLAALKEDLLRQTGMLSKLVEKDLQPSALRRSK